MALNKPQSIALCKELAVNLANIKYILGENTDMIFRDVVFADNRKAVILYIDGMTDKDAVSRFILEPLMLQGSAAAGLEPMELAERVLYVPDMIEHHTCEDLLEKLYSGDCGILVDGFAAAVSTDLKSFDKRGISEPQTEVVVRGSREGFIENIKTNMSMLRRRLKTADLAFEMVRKGTESGTNVAVAYVRGLAPKSLVNEVKRRIKSVEIDAVLESGYIEQLIEDNPFSPFATIANSEKPDKVAAKMLEGRVAVLVDGTPFVLTVPMMFVENFQSAEDYYSRPFFAGLVRAMRYLAFLIAVFAPSLYVAVVTYHHEMIPYKLLLSMWQAEVNTPFSTGVSVLLITLLYEVVREAGIRLPKPVGSAISIVGGLVIGDIVVSAGLISAPVIIIVAFTAIAMFVVDAMTDAATILRLGLILLAWWLGFLGIFMGTMLILVHLISLHSFGVPYFAPFAPFRRTEMRDTIFRFPLWLLGRRPRLLTNASKWRQREVVPPASKEKATVEKR